MDRSLPTVEEVQTLPLRAVIAYALLSARRLASERLTGVLPEKLVGDILEQAEDFVKQRDIRRHAALGLVLSACKTAAELPPQSLAAKRASDGLWLLGFAVHWASGTQGYTVYLAMCEFPEMRDEFESAFARSTNDAVRAVTAFIEALDGVPAKHTQAAITDYEILRAAFGSHEQFVVGEPFDPYTLRGGPVGNGEPDPNR